MARQPTPDGRRVHMNVKFSEAEAAAVDEARGDTERGTWLRETVLRAALVVANPERKRKPPVMRGQQAVVPRPVPKDSPGSPPPQPPPAGPRVSAGTATAVFQPAGAEPVVTHPVPAKTVDEAAARLAELRAKAAASRTETAGDFEELARHGIEGHLAEVAAQGAPPKKNCKHPKVRVKGTCPDCFAYVASKS